MAQTRNHMPEGLDGDELPGLDPDDLDDDEALAAAAEALIHHLDHHDPELAALREELLLQQAILRDVACGAAWTQHLQLERAASARLSALALRLIRFGYEAGRWVGHPEAR
jgi:hypothetical protein